MYLIGELIFSLISSSKPDAIGGLTLGADPIAYAVCLTSYLKGTSIKAFTVRKEPKGHGTKQWIEGDIKEGERVVIVEDVVTTGGSTIKAITRAQAAGLEVIKVVTLIDREEGGKEAILQAEKHHPHLIILDVMMPVMDGVEACEKLRAIPQFSETVITFLTARGEDYSQVAGFEAGADDYITKPIKPKLLVSKVKALLRRYKESEGDSTIISVGDLVINREEYKIIKDDKVINLPRKEFELLALLASKPGKVFKREDILNHVWGNDVVVGGRTIDVHIRKLREKIGDESFQTVKGVGYKFVV